MSSFSTFALERYFAQHEFTAKYLCCSSDCETLSIKELLEMEDKRRGATDDTSTSSAIDDLLNVSLGYTESKGAPELRREIAKLYESESSSIAITPDNILVHSGGVEPILLFVLTCLSTSDHIIVQGPCYQALSEPARVKGCEQSFWEIQRDDNGRWFFDVSDLKKLIKPNTRAIIINPVHNPTGWMPTMSEVHEIIRVAKEHDLIIYSDEVYRYLEYNQQDCELPLLCQLYEKAISMNVMSKSFGMAGLRIGWIASSNKTLLQQIAEGKDYTTICNSAPSEFLSILALRNREEILKRNNQIIQQNLLLAVEFFGKYPDLFGFHRPDAGPICLVEYKGVEGVRAFCDELVTKSGVMLLPSDQYYYGDSYFRLGLGRKNFSGALEHLRVWIENTRAK